MAPHRDHAWMLPVLARTRPPLGPALFDTLERTFTALDGFDVPAEETMPVYLALSGLVQGLALLWTSDHERGTGRGDPGRRTPPGELDDIATLDTRPALLARGAPATLDLDDLLTASVELLLDGIAHRHAVSHTPGRPLHSAEPTA